MRIRDCFYITALCFFAVLAGWFNQAKAQTVSNDTIKHRLNETVVTAKKSKGTLSAVSPLFTIDLEEIAHKGITDISDAIHRMPGANLRDYGGAGGLKTISVRGLGAAHTAVSYDGIPVTDIQNGAVDISRYSISNIESLQLVIGDNSDIFIPARTAAAPASLAITAPSLKADDDIMLRAQFKAGSFGYVSPYLMFGKRLSNKVSIGATAEYIYTDNNYPFKLINGPITTIERRQNSRMENVHAEADVKWAVNSSSELAAKLYYYNNDRQLPGPVIFYNIDASKDRLHDISSFAQILYSTHIGRRWKIKAAGKFNWNATLYTDYNSIKDDTYNRENYYQREYYLTASVMYNPIESLSIDYSADYTFNNLNSNLKTNKNPYRNSFLQSLSVKFKTPRFAVLGRLINSVYLNGSDNPASNPPDHTRLSPSVSITGRLLNNGLLYARLSYKNIFRMPSFNEAYFSHFGASELKPESTEQLNFGLTYQLPSFKVLPLLELSADIYHNRVKDRIVAVPYNLFMWTVTNLNSVNVLGADVTLNGTLNLGRKQQLLLSGTWSHQRARIIAASGDITHGKQVAYTPLNTGSFSLSYENPWANIVVHGQGATEKYTENSNIPQTLIPGYFEFGITAWREFSLWKKTFELRFDVMNILNKQYYIIARYPMPGRSYMFSIKFTL